jgi:hypothetical protein
MITPSLADVAVLGVLARTTTRTRWNRARLFATSTSARHIWPQMVRQSYEI